MLRNFLKLTRKIQTPKPVEQVISTSQRELLNDAIRNYINHAWKEIMNRRRGLPDNWVFNFDDFPVIKQSGFISFTATEFNGVFSATITANDGSIVTIVLDQRQKERYADEVGVLAAAILMVIADMVCNAGVASESRIRSVDGPVKIRRNKARGKIYYPKKRYKRNGCLRAPSNTEKQASYRPWHLRYYGHPLSTKARKMAAIRAMLIANWTTALADNCTFVKDFWVGQGKKDKQSVVVSHLYESFKYTITKLINP